MRKLITILAVTAAFLAVVGPAAAQESDVPTTDRAGRLWAFGQGTAGLDVERGAVAVWAIGDVTISGPADLDVRIDSWLEDAPLARDGGTEIVLTGFTGSIAVRGEGYTVAVDGLMAMKGIGNGTAAFDGEGLWRTLRSRGTWPDVVTVTED